MAVNEIRVVLTDDSGNSISSGQNQTGRSDQSLTGAVGLGAGAGIGMLRSATGGSENINLWGGGRGTTPDGLRQGRAYAANLMRGALTAPSRNAGTVIFTPGERAKQLTQGAGRYLKNVPIPTVKQATVGVTAGLQVANIAFDIAEHNASIAGNTHKAASLANRQAAINDISSIAIATAINPVAGAVMLGWTVYRKVMEHDKFIKEMQIQSIQAAFHAQRVGYTITSTGRVTV